MRYRAPDLALDTRFEAELVIEKSQFIAWLCHAPTPEAFETLLKAARSAHPSASHHCSAFIAGPPGEQTHIGFSDDGEPGGTAGRPMYQALSGSGLGEIGCVVIRYFGGTKLGTGGLARAYAQSVNKALETLPTREIVERTSYRVKVDFAQEAQTRAYFDEQSAPITGADYDGQGVTLTVAWPTDEPADFTVLESRLKSALDIQRVKT
ncbi:YigZ family protein [Halomonas sp. PAMB 3264]|uniref:IMPACT family protein n=1 Tax=Halomonas sp. PAMB 3264 TaxID=3075222 RepID=UPI0028A15D1F|nr:YigZ family protein [Halomonas sp. PAMB 3264]WNL43058.1 YigZ family protein [Halomonas sp. PAMB 3264]